MAAAFKAWETRETLAHARADQQREAIPQARWDAPPPGAFNLFVLFNLEAAWDEGHAILGLGPIGGAFETYSFYRHSNKVEAPALMACLRDPMTFQQLCADSGWIVHGQPGNFWNEHVNAALALWCAPDAFRAVRAFAEERKRRPGTYNLVTDNCLTFVEDALAAGGVRLTTRSGRPARTFIPKDAFREVAGVTGAHPFEAWKYWFPLGAAPANGLRTIQDEPGHDRPLG